MFLGLDEDDDEAAIERMVQDRLEKNLKSKRQRQKMWNKVSSAFDFKKKNVVEGESEKEIDDELEGEQDGVEELGNRVDGSAIVSASGVSRSSAGRRGENGIRERRSTNASGNRSTAGNSSNSNPPGSPSSSSRTRNPKPLKVTQELKDREREAQNSMLGKWRLRRRRRAAVGAAALAAEEEEDMKTRIQANLRARDGDDEMLVDAGSNVNGSGSGLEGRRSNESARPASSRSTGRENRIVNATRWIRVPVIGNSSRRTPRRSAAAAARIDAPEPLPAQPQFNTSRSDEATPSNSLDNSNISTTSSDRLGSNPPATSINPNTGSRLDASDLSAAEMVGDGPESTALPPAYISGRDTRTRSSIPEDSPSQSRRTSMEERIAPPPPHPQHINFTRPRAGETSDLQGNSSGFNSSANGSSGLNASEEKEALRRAEADLNGDGDGIPADIRAAITLMSRNGSDQGYSHVASSSSLPPLHSAAHVGGAGAHVATDDKAILGALAAGRSAPSNPVVFGPSHEDPTEESNSGPSRRASTSAPSYAPARPSAPTDMDQATTDQDGFEILPPIVDGREQSSSSTSRSRQVFTSSNEKAREIPVSSSQSSSSSSNNLPEPPRFLETQFDPTLLSRTASRGEDGKVYSQFDQPYQSSWPPSSQSTSQPSTQDSLGRSSSGPASTSRSVAAPSAPPVGDEESEREEEGNPGISPLVPSNNQAGLKDESSRLARKKEKQREAGDMDREFIEAEADGGSVPLDKDGVPLSLIPNSPTSLLPSYASDGMAPRPSAPPQPSAPEEDLPGDEVTLNGASAPAEEDAELARLEKEIEEEDRRQT